MPGRLEWQAAQWQRWIEKYPRETVLHRRYYLLFRDDIPEKVEAIRRQYLKRADENPKDVLAVYMAGLVLEGINTPEAIATLERGVKLDPSFGWNYLTLAYLYGRGKFQDRSKAAENMAAYVNACPQNIESFSLGMINQYGAKETLQLAAPAIRERLNKETNPKVLQTFADLWGLEFKSAPVSDHSKLRELVRADLARLSTLNPKPDAEWLAFLVTGMKQSGAAKEVPAIEERIVREFPASDQAFRIVMQRWNEAYAYPKAADTPEAWQAYTSKHVAAVEQWIQQFPDEEPNLADMLLRDAAESAKPDRGRIRELGDRLIRVLDVRYGAQPAVQVQVAWLYLRHQIDPLRAVELLESARPLILKDRTAQLQRDTLSESDRREVTSWLDDTELTWACALATAYRRTGMGSKAAPLQALAAAVEPAKPELKAQRFAALAEIAAAQGKYTDALALYRAALESRPKAPPPVRGRPDDALLEQAHEIWTLSGGSNELWTMWSKLTERSTREITNSRWEQPRKALPQFELSDLGGRTWTLKALEGKTLLITIWATWCGPCIAELPHFQMLYEQTKDRTDVALLTLNVDDEVGLVEPFVKGKNYSFPVLLAGSYVNRVVDTLGIPQNWIVDKTGIWQWQQLGYDGDPDWERGMLEKIGATR
jgi:thiol-disulfide isomerase/thioredoxin